MHQVVLLLGGNVGDRLKYLSQARKELQKVFSIQAVSSIYETAPWGTESQQAYLNQAVLMQTAMAAEAVLAEVLTIEKKLGRVREVKWGDRTMDIDVIFYDDLILQTEKLTLPHPLMQERRFVLIPLNEILPEFIHPFFGKTIQELLGECRDNGEVKLVE